MELIEASLEELASGGRQSRTVNEALLFIGNWNDSFPRLLIQDPILEPVDKIVWAVIKTCADARRGTAFPNYPTIARLANVGAEGTVARALSILRVTRWLTLCGRARDALGRFRGSVYALHDEPLSVADTLHLDPAYLEFTYQSAEHHHGRVRRVASGVARSLELDVAERTHAESAADPMLTRLEAQKLVAQRVEGPALASTQTERALQVPAIAGRSFSIRAELLPEPEVNPISAEEVHRLQNLTAVTEDAEVPICAALDRLQLLKTAEHQNLKPQLLMAVPGPASSSSKTITTTTEWPPSIFEASKFEGGDAAAGCPATSPAGPSEDPTASLGQLNWPVWLSQNFRRLAALELRIAPPAVRQALLDLLDRRQRDGVAAISEPLRNPVQYLRSLCERAVAGILVLKMPAPVATTLEAASLPASRDSAMDALVTRLRIAAADHRHWTRLAALTRVEASKQQMQRLVALAQAEIDSVRGQIDRLRQGSVHN